MGPAFRLASLFNVWSLGYGSRVDLVGAFTAFGFCGVFSLEGRGVFLVVGGCVLVELFNIRSRPFYGLRTFAPVWTLPFLLPVCVTGIDKVTEENRVCGFTERLMFLPWLLCMLRTLRSPDKEGSSLDVDSFRRTTWVNRDIFVGLAF